MVPRCYGAAITTAPSSGGERCCRWSSGIATATFPNSFAAIRPSPNSELMTMLEGEDYPIFPAQGAVAVQHTSLSRAELTAGALFGESAGMPFADVLPSEWERLRIDRSWLDH